MKRYRTQESKVSLNEGKDIAVMINPRTKKANIAI